MNRHQRRAQAAHAIGRFTCNGCGKVIATARAPKAKDAAVQRRVKAAQARHMLKTGCRGIPLTAGLPKDATTIEMLCAGCGLIVLSVPAGQAKSDLAGTQEKANAALRTHVEASGCSGQYDVSQPKPKRRDGRCEAGEHVPDCRCDIDGRDQVFEMVVASPTAEPMLESGP